MTIKHVCYGILIGIMSIIALNSFEYVIKVDIVAPESDMTEAQREQAALIQLKMKGE